MRSKKLAGMVLTAGLLAGGLAAGSVSASASASACGGSGSVSTLTGTLADGATYEIQCPAGAWTGTLYLYSHGYVAPGAANPAADAGDPVTAAWMLAHGYALAGSSYASTGWAVASALPDQISTLDTFDRTYGRPKTTVAWGHSLGGMITAGLVQDYPSRFDAALPMCGVLSGGVATWNTALDAAFAFAKLIDPSVQLVDITNPTANLEGAEAALTAAQATAASRARAHRLRRPGAEPVPLGRRGDLPLHLRLPCRPGGQGGREPVLEHRRELRQRPGQVRRRQ
jgi:pimeloyl-ACP methyl ester carboxylesterase